MTLATLEGTELRYSTDSEPGFTRISTEGNFLYIDRRGKTVTAARELDRIKSLAIPPAYQKVWICADAKGHLQATGIDARKRKQYRYHPKFREVQEQTKFHRIMDFGRSLDAIRSAIDQDLRRPGIPKEKVLAVIVSLLDLTLIRIGNEEYAKENHSFGLTTLQNRHVNVVGSKVQFRFSGKSHVKHAIEIHDRRIARLITRIEELPGQELFHYLDAEGQARPVSSSDVNTYIHQISGQPFTAKDFRTWWGSVLAFLELCDCELPSNRRLAKKLMIAAVKNVSLKLGNTPTVCRKCYVHPSVFQAFESGTLRSLNESDHSDSHMSAPEAAFLEFLQDAEGSPKASRRTNGTQDPSAPPKGVRDTPRN